MRDCMHCAIDAELFTGWTLRTPCPHGGAAGGSGPGRVHALSGGRVMRNGVIRLPRHRRADTIGSIVE